MSSSTITVVGLGPGRRASLTVEALDALRAATLLYLPTAARPILDELGGDLRPDARIQILDDAAGLAARLIEEAGSSPVYAVPGHPLMGNASARVLLQQAALHDVTVRLISGLSPLEPALSALGLDPFTEGLQILDAAAVGAPAPSASEGLAPLWAGASGRLLNAQLPLLIGGLATPGRLLIDGVATPDRLLTGGVATPELLSAVAGRLLERYPATHPVMLVRDAGTGHEWVEQVSLDALASAGGGDPTGCALYVPPLAPLDDLRAPNALGYITARLRGPGGCPWDREQTHASLTPYMIEEAYEAVDAIERADVSDTVEELGDVLLQVVLHSQLAEEEGRFTLADVAAEVNAKLVRRHPHVFGDVTVSGSSEVLRNWEQIKRAEKGARRTSALDGIPPALPALSLAQTIGRKAAKLGFDWPDVEGTFAKVREELDEIRDARDDAERHEEIGDLLYALTSVCRHLGIDAEEALRAATRKFAARFRRVEAFAQERNLTLAALPLDDLDALWEEAKLAANERE